ncbi:MAG: PAS domain S-box protein [Candidatus Eremiobacterota bacterium]
MASVEDYYKRDTDYLVSELNRLKLRVAELEAFEISHKEIEETLRKNEERYQMAMKGTNDGLWDWNLLTDEVYYSHRWKSMLGYSEQELDNHLDTWKSLVHKKDLLVTLAKINEFHKGRDEKLEIEFRMKHKDGHYLYILSRSFLVRRDDGTPVRMVGTHIDITERREIEDTLRDSEERFRGTLDNMLEGCQIIGFDWKYIYVNQSAAKHGRMSKDELVGHVIADVFPGIEQTDLFSAMNLCMNERIACTMENEFYYKDGSAAIFDLRIQPVPEGIFILSYDITDTKKSETLLLESNERFRAVVEAAPDAIFIQANGCFAYLNPAALSLFGCSDENQLLEHPVVEQFHPDCRSVVMERIKQLNESKIEAPMLRERILRHDGTGVNVEVKAVPFIYRGQNGALVFVRDITERLKAQEDLRKSEEKYRDLYETAPVAYYSLSPAGKIIRCNSTVTELLGYGKEELTGKNIFDLYADTEYGRDKAMKLFQKVLAGYSIRDEEFQMKRADGFHIWISLSVRPVLDEKGSFFETRSTMMNITGRKEAEEIKKKLEEQLLHAQKMESVGRLAGGVAHDLNNLLTPIILYNEMLIEGLADSEQKNDFLQQIHEAALRAQKLVHQLLAFSRKQIMDFEPVDVNETVLAFNGLLRRTVRENIDIKLVLSPSVRPVKGDIGQMEQIIMNLAVNAQDAMPGGGTMIIETSDVTVHKDCPEIYENIEPGKYVMLSISDTGTGIEQEIIKNIFEPFFTTKEPGKGTGLGLATVYGIVKQHEGHILVYSEPEKGTTFKIYFPAMDIPASEEKETKPVTSVTKGAGIVMIVEDNDLLRDSTVMLLKKQGYTVMAASCGMDCMKIMSEYRGELHVLLTDVVMPDMNGRELFEKIKIDFPCVKVLYMSGYSHDVITHEGVLDKGIDFIQKPFAMRALSGKLQELMNR